MMSGGEIGIAVGALTLAGTLLGVVVSTTWRFSSLATKLGDTIAQLEVKARDLENHDRELKEKFEDINKVPNLEFRVQQIESGILSSSSKLHDIHGRLAAVETAQKFSKEMRQVKAMRASRPDVDDEG